MNEHSTNAVALKQWADSTVTSLRRWWLQSWLMYLFFIGISSALAAAVPFGLALLLYVDEPLRQRVNIVTLALSCLSSVLFIIVHVARLKERANLNRDLYEELRLSLAMWRDGRMADKDFISIAGKVGGGLKREGRLV